MTLSPLSRQLRADKRGVGRTGAERSTLCEIALRGQLAAGELERAPRADELCELGCGCGLKLVLQRLDVPLERICALLGAAARRPFVLDLEGRATFSAGSVLMGSVALAPRLLLRLDDCGFGGDDAAAELAVLRLAAFEEGRRGSMGHALGVDARCCIGELPAQCVRITSASLAFGSLDSTA